MISSCSLTPTIERGLPQDPTIPPNQDPVGGNTIHFRTSTQQAYHRESTTLVRQHAATLFLSSQSEDRQNIRRRRNSTRHVDGLANNKKLVPPRLLAMLPQSLQIKQLSNRHSPACQHDLMARPVFLRGPCLPEIGILVSKTEGQRESTNMMKTRNLTNSDDPQHKPQNSPT